MLLKDFKMGILELKVEQAPCKVITNSSFCKRLRVMIGNAELRQSLTFRSQVSLKMRTRTNANSYLNHPKEKMQ